MLNELSIKISLVKALKQISGYAKFIQDLMTYKMLVSFESVDNMHHYSAIASQLVLEKKDDPGAFIILCAIGSFNFLKALCDLGASINLMPLAVYSKLRLDFPKPTLMRLLMVDHTLKKPMGILCNF